MKQKLPLKRTALKRLIVNDKRWNEKTVSRMSLVQADIRRPNWLKKHVPFELMGPSVSEAIRMKVWVWAKDWYFSSFRFAAAYYFVLVWLTACLYFFFSQLDLRFY